MADTKSEAEETTSSTKTTAAAKAAAAALKEQVKAGVEEFKQKHLRNTPFSRDTTAWNHLHDNTDNLVDCIINSINEGGK